MLTATFFDCVEEADKELRRCPAPCSDCSPGHHWYSTDKIRAHPLLGWEVVKVACRHCKAEAWITSDAEDLPEI